MAVGIVDRQKLVDIADAVRAKKGITVDMTLDDIASNITSMPISDNNAKYDFTGSGSESSINLMLYLTKINLSGLDTSNVTSMYAMFRGYSSLTSLDLSNWDTSSVTDMGDMFSNCSSLTSLDLSGFDTSKVAYMSEMFSGCSSLTSLDLSNWNTSSVIDMSNMFSICSSLTSLDLSGFDTMNVDFMGKMFTGCSKLTNLTLGNNWASNLSIDSFDLSYCPLTHESAVDVINKLATRIHSPVIEFSGEVGLYQSEIDVATNKGWSVSGCSVLVDAESATVGQYALIDGVVSKCVYVANEPQGWGQKIFASQSYITYSNGKSVLQWGGYGTATGITATGIGTGLTNTNSLIAMNLQSSDGTPTIWDALKEFRSKYGNRWFIPSLDESSLYIENVYWTSSEVTSENAYTRNTSVTADSVNKTSTNNVYAFTYV